MFSKVKALNDGGYGLRRKFILKNDILKNKYPQKHCFHEKSRWNNHCWFLFGHYLVTIWSLFGRYLVAIWSLFGRYWSLFGRYCLLLVFLVTIWSLFDVFGPNSLTFIVSMVTHVTNSFRPGPIGPIWVHSFGARARVHSKMGNCMVTVAFHIP